MRDFAHSHFVKRALVWGGLLALLTVVIHPGLTGGFLFDDFGNIVDNPAVQITQLSLDTLADSLEGVEAGPLGRPVSVLSFALTHYFFGLDAFAFKTINLVIHAINGVLIAWMTTLLVRQISPPPSEALIRWLPLWVAAIWLLHPINTVPILLAVQRMTLLSAMFTLLALIAHIEGMSRGSPASRAGWMIAGWLVFWPLAIFSKETGFLFPLFAILVSLGFATTRHVNGIPRAYGASAGIPEEARKPERWTIILAATLLLAALAGLLSQIGFSWLQHGYAMRPFSLIERVWTEARVMWFYAGQIVLPSHAAFGIFLDDFPISRGLTEPVSTLPALLCWAVVIAALPFAWRRWPVPAFGMAWFLVGHSLESTFLPLEIAHEYRNYLPSFGLILAVAWLGTNWLAGLRLDHRRLTITLAGILPIVVLSVFTWMRADQWRDTLRGTQLEALHHPDSWRANYTAAQVLFQAGRGDANDLIGGKMIRYHFLKAADLDPDNKLSHLSLIFWSCASGRPMEKNWIHDLELRLEQTPFSPIDRELPGNMLRQMVNQPTCLSRQAALGLFLAGSRNTRVRPSLQALFLESAADYEILVAKDLASAKGHLEQAVALNPSRADLRKKLDSFDKALMHSRPGAR